MRVPIKMPKLGLTMSEGTVVSWRKEVGEHVAKGEILFEVMTEKISNEIESPFDGVLVEIVVEEGETVPVGEVIAYMEVEGEVSVEEPGESKTAVKKEDIVEGPEEAVVQMPIKEDVKASPRAKMRAKELGVDLKDIKGTGPGGRIVERDVLEFTKGREVSSAGAQKVVLEGVRKVIADRMQQSFRDKPHFSLEVSVDATFLSYRRNEIQVRDGRKVSYTALMVYYLAKVLKDYPILNAIFEGENEVSILDDVNVNVAVDTPTGLMVPVVKKAHEKSVLQISDELTSLADRARRNALDISDVEGGTITLTNLGMFGIDRFTAVINPPQVAILAVGAIKDKVVVLGSGGIGVRPVFTVTLVADHRLIDGAYGARFLSAFKNVLEGGEV